MKKMVYTALVILVTALSFMAYCGTRSNELSISNKENLGGILGIDFTTGLKIDDVNWSYTEKGSTIIYMKVSVDKNYSPKKSYFTNNNHKENVSLYAYIEEELRGAGYNIDKILYDNIIFKEIAEKKLFETTYKPYNISVYAVRDQPNEEFSEFIIHTIIPSRININKEKLIN